MARVVPEASGSGTVDVRDEGTSVGDFTAINFVGSTVAVTDVGGVATVTITAGAGTTEVREEGSKIGDFSVLNFVGSTTTVTDVGGVGTITSTAAPKGYYVFAADELQNVGTEWTKTTLAPIAADSNNTALLVRLFDDTTEEGVGMTVFVPSGTTQATFSIVSRAETAPGAGTTVDWRLYGRTIPNNGALSSWSSAKAMTDIDIPTNELWQYDSQTITFSDINLVAGEWCQIELTRVTGGLTGDWAVLSVIVEFI